MIWFGLGVSISVASLVREITVQVTFLLQCLFYMVHCQLQQEGNIHLLLQMMVQFETGIPTSWTVLNLDTHAIFWSLVARGYTGAFQPFTRNGHKCVANTAWFAVPGNTANDWLI